MDLDSSDIRLDIKSDLSGWAVKHNITGCATDNLLDILSAHFPNCSLPRSYKTLLGTVTNYEILDIGGGKYHHFGLAKNFYILVLYRHS